MRKIHSLGTMETLFSRNGFFCFPLQLELISGLRSKLQALWEERELVLSEAQECTVWGQELEEMVRDVCKPNEFERYMMLIGDLEKVVSLLLCLSSRLARVQNAMRRIDGNTDAEEKVSAKRAEYATCFVASFQVGLCSPCCLTALNRSCASYVKPGQPLVPGDRLCLQSRSRLDSGVHHRFGAGEQRCGASRALRGSELERGPETLGLLPLGQLQTCASKGFLLDFFFFHWQFQLS